MIINKFKALVVVNIVLITMLIVFSIFYSLDSNKRIVYVDSNKLFDNFIMTKEMKRIGEKEFNIRKLRLDSLYVKLQYPKNSQEEKKILLTQFTQEKEEFEQFNQNFASEEYSKIWARIHGYVNEFSNEKKYQLVLSSDKNGAVLYADGKIDITDELLNYINKKYEGLQ